MKQVFLSLIAVAMATGCGISVERTRITNGQVVEKSTTDVGFASAKTTVETNSPAMQTCLAQIGEMPGDEQVVWCQERIRRGEIRTNDQLDWQASPYGMYGYGQYRRFP